MEAEATDPLGPLTEEEKDWWRRLRLWLEEMEIKRMTWQDTQRYLAEIRELNPATADLIEENNARYRGELPVPDGVKIIEYTATDIKAALDVERAVAAMLKAEAEEQEAMDKAIADAISDYYGETND